MHAFFFIQLNANNCKLVYGIMKAYGYDSFLLLSCILLTFLVYINQAIIFKKDTFK